MEDKQKGISLIIMLGKVWGEEAAEHTVVSRQHSFSGCNFVGQIPVDWLF